MNNEQLPPESDDVLPVSVPDTMPDAAPCSPPPPPDEEIGEPDPPRYKMPLFSYILFGLAGFSALIYLISMLSTGFADFISRYPGAAIRALLSWTTSWIPFSLAEALIISLPLLLAILIRIAVKKYSDSWHNTFVYVGALLSIVSLLLSLLVLTLGTGYYAPTLDERLGIERLDVSVDELKETSEILAGLANQASDEVAFRYQNFSVMPYSLDEMNDKLNDAYSRAADNYDFIPHLRSRVKPVMLSEPWSYTHITGIYTYFTGESNINVNFPDYTIPFTAAHELSHQRGIAREDEANFMAFLVCLESDDPYINYCAYINMFEYVSNSLYSADKDAYFEVYGKLNTNIRYELRAYSEFFDKYRTNVVATVSGAVNDTYLKIQGTPGSKSYGMVTDLAVAYYKNHE